MFWLYLHKHKLAIEVDKLGHADRNFSNEIERQKPPERNLIVCLLELILMGKISTFSKKINKIHRHIKKSPKKSLIDNLSKRLLELEFKSNHSIESMCLIWVVNKILSTI